MRVNQNLTGLPTLSHESFHLLPIKTSGKEPIYQCRRHKRHGFDPWVGEIPWRREWLTLQYSCQENPMDRETWRAMVHRVIKSQTWLKRLSIHTHTNIKGWWLLGVLNYWNDVRMFNISSSLQIHGHHELTGCSLYNKLLLLRAHGHSHTVWKPGMDNLLLWIQIQFKKKIIPGHVVHIWEAEVREGDGFA